MADEPKPAPNGAPKPATPSGSDPFVELVSFLAGLFFVAYLINSLVTGFISGSFFLHGFQGMTPQGIIFYHTRPIASLDNPIGAGVVALHDLSVFSDAGGNLIGTQVFNARGKILEGPVQVSGINYYYVDFSSGPDGWVQEGAIGYLISEPNTFERVVMWLFGFVTVLRIISVVISICIILALVYLVQALTLVRANQMKLLYPELAPQGAGIVNPKWERILTHVESENENDWRLAIIEADIMLSDLLDTLSLPGETMGDKLKVVEESDFQTIQNAWEAHKVRNQIAHEGSDFQLSQREARRVVELYRSIFEEFQII